MKIFILLLLGLGVGPLGCRTGDPVAPSGHSVRVSHNRPHGDCRQLGPVVGTSPTSGGAYEQALMDLRQEAARKTANMVQILGVSAHGTAIRGTAYRCH